MKVTAAVATASILLAGCSASAPASTPPTPSSPASNPSSTSAPSSPTPTPTRDLANLPIGDKTTLVDEDGDIGTFSVTAVKYTRSPYRDKPLYAAKVKACAIGRKMTVSMTGWLVETADGEQYEAVSDQGEGDPLPIYPLFDRAVLKGKCLQGWIPFEIKKSTKITHVGLEIQDSDTDVSVYWRVQGS